MASAWGKSWGLSWGNSWGLIQPAIIEPEYHQGGPGGSNKAGKKKHDWERRGHVISAIQSGPTLDYVNLLLTDTDEHVKQTDIIEAYIAENDLEIVSLEELISVVTAALKQQEEDDQSRVEKNKLRLSAHSYKVQLNEEYHKRVVRRRREEDALIHILLHAC